MNLGTSRLSIAPGEGVVARQGSLVLLMAPSGEAHNGFVDQLLELCRFGEEANLSVVRRVGALVNQHPAESVPAFGMLVQAGDSVVAVLAGDVTLTVASSERDQVIAGTDASTYVERRLSGDIESLWLAATGAPNADPRSSLTSGVVRGSGVLLVPAEQAPTVRDLPTVQQVEERDARADPPTTPDAELDRTAQAPVTPSAGAQPAPDGQPDFEHISLSDEPERQPARETPGHSDEVADEPVTAQPKLVDGIYCARGHFNSPDSIFCTQCGISMVQQTHNRVLGPRPPLGVLVTDQGAVFSLVKDYVVGREPESAPEVVQGTALPLPLEDTELAVSRIHARIVLDGWEVRVEDANSANGTFISTDGGNWERLEPGFPTTVRPGSNIAVGGRVLGFETHHRSSGP